GTYGQMKCPSHAARTKPTAITGHEAICLKNARSMPRSSEREIAGWGTVSIDMCTHSPEATWNAEGDDGLTTLVQLRRTKKGESRNNRFHDSPSNLPKR